MAQRSSQCTSHLTCVLLSLSLKLPSMARNFQCEIPIHCLFLTTSFYIHSFTFICYTRTIYCIHSKFSQNKQYLKKKILAVIQNWISWQSSCLKLRVGSFPSLGDFFPLLRVFFRIFSSKRFFFQLPNSLRLDEF